MENKVRQETITGLSRENYLTILDFTATLALPLRYVAMIFAVLVMSVANIGMA